MQKFKLTCKNIFAEFSLASAEDPWAESAYSSESQDSTSDSEGSASSDPQDLVPLDASPQASCTRVSRSETRSDSSWGTSMGWRESVRVQKAEHKKTEMNRYSDPIRELMYRHCGRTRHSLHSGKRFCMFLHVVTCNCRFLLIMERFDGIGRRQKEPRPSTTACRVWEFVLRSMQKLRSSRSTKVRLQPVPLRSGLPP